MDNLLYFLLWGGLIFLMMRFGCGAHVMGHGHGHGKQHAPEGSGTTKDGTVRWVAPETDTDPVCGKSVRTAEARSSIHDGTVYYFCSRECREVFEAAPGTYVGGATGSAPKQLEHSHV